MHDELTEVDIKKMKDESDHRMKNLTPRLIETMVQAREIGDLSENEEYRTAKRELNRNYARIRYLKNMISTAVVIKVEYDEDTVGLFDRVTIHYEEDDEDRTIIIVTTLRNDVTKNLISKESPVGRALLGKKVGDRVKVKVNDDYSYFVTVTALEKGTDDESMDIASY